MYQPRRAPGQWQPEPGFPLETPGEKLDSDAARIMGIINSIQKVGKARFREIADKYQGDSEVILALTCHLQFNRLVGLLDAVH